VDVLSRPVGHEPQLLQLRLYVPNHVAVDGRASDLLVRGEARVVLLVDRVLHPEWLEKSLPELFRMMMPRPVLRFTRQHLVEYEAGEHVSGIRIRGLVQLRQRSRDWERVVLREWCGDVLVVTLDEE